MRCCFLNRVNFYHIQQRKTHRWIRPEGYDTGIKIYNCITKSKEPLIIKSKHLLKWYTCGPTVYDSAHIGHASCYMKLDIIQRVLQKYFGLNVINVMNITDIDDKIIKRAKEVKLEYKTVSSNYETEFWEDLTSLEIPKPDVIIRVTENIDLIINFIKVLEDKGHCYVAEDNSVYFDVGSYNNYEKLQKFGKEELEKKESKLKKSVMDFALWKASQEGEPFWVSPWGNGRPGWHIECSTLASHLLGSNIDIHAGGIDLRFPHHENEEAQSCAYHGTQQWVNYWLHTGHLSKKDWEKMSKSLKNTISIKDMLKNFSPEIFRMACVITRYKNNMEYSTEAMHTAKNILKHYENFFDSCTAFSEGKITSKINSEVLLKKLTETSKQIHHALCDDFNTPQVVKSLNELVSVSNSMLNSDSCTHPSNNICSILSVKKYVKRILQIFGIKFENKSIHSEDFSEIMTILSEFRQKIRVIGMTEKNTELLNICDDVRDKLNNRGIVVKDHKKMSSWKKGF